jgi:hypothetical protein
MTIDKLALAFRTAFERGGEELADAVLEQAVVRYGRSFASVALRRFEQCIDGEKRLREQPSPKEEASG